MIGTWLLIARDSFGLGGKGGLGGASQGGGVAMGVTARVRIERNVECRHTYRVRVSRLHKYK